MAKKEQTQLYTPNLADAQKLSALSDSLKEHQRRLEELQLRYGSPESKLKPEAVHDHMALNQAVLVETMKVVRSLIEILGEIGL